MSRVWVVGTAAVTALGDDADALWGGLLAGRTGIRPLTRFSTEGYKTHLAACVPGLSSRGPGAWSPSCSTGCARTCRRSPPTRC